MTSLVRYFHVSTTRLFLLRMTQTAYGARLAAQISPKAQTLSMSDKSLPQAGIFPPGSIARLPRRPRYRPDRENLGRTHVHSQRGGNILSL